MSQAKDRLQDVDHAANILLARVITETDMRGTHSSREAKSVVDRKSWEVDVIFGAVDDISSVMFLDVFGREGVVVDLAMNRMVFCTLVGKCLEKGAAPGPRATKDDYRVRRQSKGTEYNIGWKTDARSISPGRTTPSNPSRRLRSGGLRNVLNFSRKTLGSKREPSVG